MGLRAILLFCLALEGTPCGLLATRGPKHDVAWGCGVAWLPVQSCLWDLASGPPLRTCVASCLRSRWWV